MNAMDERQDIVLTVDWCGRVWSTMGGPILLYCIKNMTEYNSAYLPAILHAYCITSLAAKSITWLDVSFGKHRPAFKLLSCLSAFNSSNGRL